MNEMKDTLKAKEIWSPEEQGLERTEFQTALTDTKKSALKKYQEIVTGWGHYLEQQVWFSEKNISNHFWVKSDKMLCLAGL